PAALVAAYGETGRATGSSSENGTLLAFPYTDELDPKMKRFGPLVTQVSRRTEVPLRLTSVYRIGSAIDGRTPARAARGTTVSGFPGGRGGSAGGRWGLSPVTRRKAGWARRSSRFSRLIASS